MACAAVFTLGCGLRERTRGSCWGAALNLRKKNFHASGLSARVRGTPGLRRHCGKLHCYMQHFTPYDICIISCGSGSILSSLRKCIGQVSGVLPNILQKNVFSENGMFSSGSGSTVSSLRKCIGQVLFNQTSSQKTFFSEVCVVRGLMISSTSQHSLVRLYVIGQTSAGDPQVWQVSMVSETGFCPV